MLRVRPSQRLGLPRLVHLDEEEAEEEGGEEAGEERGEERQPFRRRSHSVLEDYYLGL